MRWDRQSDRPPVQAPAYLGAERLAVSLVRRPSSVRFRDTLKKPNTGLFRALSKRRHARSQSDSPSRLGRRRRRDRIRRIRPAHARHVMQRDTRAPAVGGRPYQEHRQQNQHRQAQQTMRAHHSERDQSDLDLRTGAMERTPEGGAHQSTSQLQSEGVELFCASTTRRVPPVVHISSSEPRSQSEHGLAGSPCRPTCYRSRPRRYHSSECARRAISGSQIQNSSPAPEPEWNTSLG